MLRSARGDVTLALSSAGAIGRVLGQRAAEVGEQAVCRLDHVLADQVSREREGSALVLGPWRPEGLYIRQGIAEGGTFFDTGGPVWRALEALGAASGRDLAWEVNEAFLRRQVREGRPIIYTLRETLGEDYQAELDALEALSKGNLDRAIQSMREVDPSATDLPYRLKEARWLMEHGYTYVVDEAERIVRWVPQDTLLEVGE